MAKFSLKMAGFLAALVASPAMALASGGAVSLDSTIKLDKVVTDKGQIHHEIVSPEKVVPGNHLVFLTNYRNAGDKPFDNFVVTNPVPSAVALESADNTRFDVSIDGGKTWGKLSQLTVTKPGASPRAAQGSDVTHVRWVIASIAPGESGTLEYHAVVR